MQTEPFAATAAKGIFTKEIEESLLNGTIDLAVHSLKDLPTELSNGLALAAIPEREDPRDALVGKRLRDLPHGARVGTSSGRRAAQLRALRPDLKIEAIRGNVDTRIRKLNEGQYDAVVLAAAGLRRLDLEQAIAEVFTVEQICPAPGQGALAIETRAGDAAFDACAELDHKPTRQAVTCERAVLAGLGGGCDLAMGAFAAVAGEEIEVIATVVSPDGSHALRERAVGARSAPEQLGCSVASRLIAKGARGILGGAK